MAPSLDVLKDGSLGAIRGRELLERTESLTLQLRCAYRNDLLLAQLWGDDESLAAWQTVAREAGGLLQRALLKELLSQVSQFVDETKSSSSIVSCHRQLICPNLRSGPLKSFYMPLYQDILVAAKELKPIRNLVLAHQDRDWLLTLMSGGPSQDGQGRLTQSFSLGDVRDLLMLCSYYVNLCRVVLGVAYIPFASELTSIDGADELRAAIVEAQEISGSDSA